MKISIVIPVYNEEDYLNACLNAIANQTVMPDEVIVVDNNSTDKTVKIASSYPFVKLINEPIQGVLQARTRGFNEAKYEIMGRIDADTILSPNWVECVLEVFKDNKIAAVTGANSFYEWPFSPHNHWVEHIFKGPLYKYAKKFPYLFGTNMAIKKNAWNAVKNELCENRTMHEDLDLAIHLYKRNMKILYERKLLAGMSARRYDDSPASFRSYMKSYTTTYKSHGLPIVAPRIAMAGYTLGYIILKPFRSSYNPQDNTYSVKHLLKGGNKARKHPMH
ncbi:glycosyltransferase [Candidatus Saccharibacteria bacterium CPR2]|nr:glycosyltransferase [Candidatus Saccharibacteria bacterium CPR2]